MGEPAIQHDPLGLWYTLLERLEGDYIGNRFGRLPVRGGSVTWTDLPHAEFDGVGALWEIHRRFYGDQGAGPMPARRDTARPGAIAMWRLFFRFVAQKPVPVAAWRSLDPAWQGKTVDRPLAVAWRVLDPARTQAIRARARGEGASVNSLLLWALGRAVEPALDLSRGAMRWMVPVNLRGPIQRRRATANHSSYLRAETPPGGSVRDVHRQIQAALGRQEEFAAWRGFTLVPTLGAWYMRRVLADARRDGPPWVGLFTNLGVWPDRTDDAGVDDAWILCPPPCRLQPLAAGAMTWRGRLALALHAHPALGVGEAEVAVWLDAWLDGL